MHRGVYLCICIYSFMYLHYTLSLSLSLSLSLAHVCVRHSFALVCISYPSRPFPFNERSMAPARARLYEMDTEPSENVAL